MNYIVVFEDGNWKIKKDVTGLYGTDIDTALEVLAEKVWQVL